MESARLARQAGARPSNCGSRMIPQRPLETAPVIKRCPLLRKRAGNRCGLFRWLLPSAPPSLSLSSVPDRRTSRGALRLFARDSLCHAPLHLGVIEGLHLFVQLFFRPAPVEQTRHRYLARPLSDMVQASSASTWLTAVSTLRQFRFSSASRLRPERVRRRTWPAARFPARPTRRRSIPVRPGDAGRETKIRVPLPRLRLSPARCGPRYQRRGAAGVRAYAE